MAYEGYECLKIRLDRGVVFATIDYPPVNLFDMKLIGEMGRLGVEVEADDEARVLVVDSADPEIFIAHADVNLIMQMPDKAPPKATELGFFHAMVDKFRTMPKATIAKIEGVCRGGGSEFALSMDMRFAALGKAVLGQPEVAVGIIPGGSGTQRLPWLMGRGRAMEVVLGGMDFPADLAERYGYVNRALPAEELTEFVNDLAYRIASFPAYAVAAAKQSVLASMPDPVPGLLEEAHQFNLCLERPEAAQLMKAFMDAGGQTREVETAHGIDPALFQQA